jgi:predicted GNAT family N-acyltransferase
MEGAAISHITSASPAYEQVWQLREEVLRRPIGLSLRNENLDKDHQDVIFIAEHGGKVIGCLMLHRKSDAIIQFRQMAVYDEWQGKGVGRDLMLAAEGYCREQGYQFVVLHARKVAVGFYRSLGYIVEGDEFTEVGIPHYIMEKRLSA